MLGINSGNGSMVGMRMRTIELQYVGVEACTMTIFLSTFSQRIYDAA